MALTSESSESCIEEGLVSYSFYDVVVVDESNSSIPDVDTVTFISFADSPPRLVFDKQKAYDQAAEDYEAIF